MAMPAATAALMLRVEPNCAIDTVNAAPVAAAGEMPGPPDRRQAGIPGAAWCPPGAPPGHVVDGDDGQPGGGRVTEQVLGGVVVHEVLITVGDHGAPAVPASPAHDVHRVDGERIRGANDRPDVGVVTEVLDRDVQRMSPGIDIGDDRLARPIAVGVNDVAVSPSRNSSGRTGDRRAAPPPRGRHRGCRCSTGRPRIGFSHGSSIRARGRRRRMPGRRQGATASARSTGPHARPSL